MFDRHSSPARYSAPVVGLHWLTAVLVVLAIALIETKGVFPKGDPWRDAFKMLHFQLGTMVLLMTFLRVASLLFLPRPEPLAPAGSLERRAGAAVHGVLYLFLLALPVSGILFLIATGKPISLLGWPLPVWVDGSKQIAKPYKEIHELLGNVMIGLVALHAAAALWHQFVRRDGLLHRMWFARG